MKQEHHDKEILNNNTGANQDINGEISSDKKSGKYYDAQNMRLSDEGGDKGVLKKIGGEQLEHDKNQTAGTYVCIGSSSVNGYLIEFFADSGNVEDPIIRIDGTLVGQSPDMPWIAGFPLQIDKNENCKGGEVFTTDYNSPPMIFNIQDLLDNVATQKYFSQFNPALYSVNLEAPLDIPVFVELMNVGGGGGLPDGSYQYSLRYSTDAGDKTNWGPLTPPIPVVQNNSPASTQYPYVRTYGNDPDNTVNTQYGPKIRFRVTNLANYEYVEIRRLAYDAETGLDYVPGGEIVAKIPIGSDEISIREFIDPLDSNVEITLADSEETNIMGYIEKAKAVRYHDKRLVFMNIETPDRTAEPTYKEISGNKIFPIVKSLGISGHNDPYKHTYFKNYMSGEKHSFGFNFYDGTGGRGFVVSDTDFENVQTPNRRTPMSSDSQDYSYEGFPVAADTTCTNVGPVFEVFDHEGAIAKDDVCSFKNVLDIGGKADAPSSPINDFCPTDAASGDSSDIGYKPFTPTNQNDVDVTGHNFKINNKVWDGSAWDDYDPEGFSMNYFSRGYAIPGVENIPSWVKSFSVVKTEAANRVVCQGIGMYSMTEGSESLGVYSSLATKDAENMWFHSPDIEKGLVSQDILDDMDANPDNYKLQLISPLGFFSELYGFNESITFPEFDRINDLIAYARVLHDEGQINIGEDANMGIDDGSGNRFVSFNRYRNTSDTAGAGIFGGDGDALIDMSGFKIQNEGRGAYYKIETPVGLPDIYQHTGTGGNGDFNDTGLKDFTEPFYIVNIIQTGKEVRDLNINSYRSTGFYQKVESIIGQGDDTTDQEFLLVDERWEDCIPDLDSGGTFAADESFVYLEDELGQRKAYMCASYLAPATIATINADITANGFWVSGTGVNVYGIYTHTSVNNIEFTLVFDQGYDPASNEIVIVKYDTRLPLQVFGGDTTVAESIFAPIDREASGAYSERDEQFLMGLGFPFRKYYVNPRRYIIKDPTSSTGNWIQDREEGTLAYIRQLCVMYASENRVGANYAYGLFYPNQHFPQTNYVIRPNADWRDTNFDTGDPDLIASDNNMFRAYFDDYPEEWLNWSWGGFRFLQQTNIDYMVKGPKEFFSKPDVGFTDENQFCTRITWSLPRQINVQDSPSLKTFPSSNVFDIEDKNGRIVRAWDAQTNQSGENLYAITHTGICLLMTKKSVLSNLTGDDLAIMATDSFINNEYWISDDVGAPGENWRGIAEGNVEVSTESGVIRQPALYIPNNESTFRLMQNVVSDIAADAYEQTLRPVLGNINPGYLTKMSSVFNGLNNEYWLQIGDTVYVFDQSFNAYAGKFTYDFDMYVDHNNRVRGSRELQTYELGLGTQINGAAIEAYLINRTSLPVQAVEKEFISLNINTGKRGDMKPTEVQFLDEETLSVICSLSQAQNGPLYLKQYDGWFQFIPRKDVSVSSTRERVQGRILYFKIIHTFEEEFKITNTIIQSKNIK